MYTYDDNNNRTSETDANGNTVSYVYNDKNLLASTTDKNGNLTNVTTPEGFTNEYTYDFRNNVSTFTDANGNKAEYTYDNNGNKTKETYNNDISVSYAYDELNKLTSAADANGSITRYAYDKVGNITNAITPTGIKTRYTYDGNGNVKQVYDSSDTLVQSTDYDLWNNPMRVKDALGNTTSYNYNSTGKLLSYTTPRGNTYSYTYDGNGNMLTETDPMDGVVGYEYNAFDTAASFTDANGNKTQYTYDLLNRLTSETSATGDSDNYTYDAVSNLTAYTNKRGQNIGYTYDKDGRMTNRTTVEGATAYTYDNNGNLLTVTDNNGTISRTYDNLNRVTSYTNANGDTIGYEYDNVGNITKLTYPDSKEVTYTYNADNQMTSVTDWNGHKTTYAYDENGRLSKINRPDGSTETYTYNVIGQLLTAVDKSANGTVINEYSYAYDADGNIITENSLNEPVASDFGIDSAEMGYGLANQLNSFNGVPISYDKDGNMLSTPLSDKWGTLTYDSLNNLTDITTSAGAIAYDYDAEGYRTSKTEYGITTDFVVNPNAELSQVLTSTTNGETTYYVYGLGLVSQENSEGYKLYHYDYRGSTTAITNINGTVTDTVYYDPYGNVVKRSGTTEIPFLYVGKYGVETDTNGLYYMRARYYNPTIQRFINVDPIRDRYNWYNYCDNSSITRIDPHGLTDYIYTNKTTYTVENDEKIWGIIAKNPEKRYFIDVNGTRYQVNSTETVEFYFDTPASERKINANFGNSQMYELLIEAQHKGVSLTNIMQESVGGYLDFKLKLDKGTIYNINGIYYNANETGNYMWSFILRINGYLKILDGALAQGGSMVSKTPRLDESWDVQARAQGEKKQINIKD